MLFFLLFFSKVRCFSFLFYCVLASRSASRISLQVHDCALGSYLETVLLQLFYLLFQNVFVGKIKFLYNLLLRSSIHKIVFRQQEEITLLGLDSTLHMWG